MSKEYEAAKEIYRALKKYNPKAAKEYLDGFDRRNEINQAIKDKLQLGGGTL